MTTTAGLHARAAHVVDGRRVERGLFAFYAVVALIALAGQTGAAVEWLGWPLLFALGAVAAVEFGGLGYGVWLLHSGARRRDQLRADGNLPPVAPVYGPWQWVRHPWLTRRARALALQDLTLGLYGSLAAARAAVGTERRQAAIAALLRRRLAAGRDPLAAQIAITVYDLDEIAARLAANADYDGLTALIGADLVPARVAGPARDDEAEPLVRRADRPRTVHTAPPRPSRRARGRTAKRTRQPDTTRDLIAEIRSDAPLLTQVQVAKRVGVSKRTVARYWADTTPAGNGGPVPAEAVTEADEPTGDPEPAAPNGGR